MMANNSHCLMTDEDIKRILHLTYELEGLLQLRTGHPERPGLDSHIAAKASQIAALTGKAAAGQQQPACPDDSMFYSLDSQPEALEEAAENIAVAEAAQTADDERVAIAEKIETKAQSPAPEGPAPEEGKKTDKGKEIRAGAASVGRPVFSINDRFRFRRELFGNSDRDFNASLDLLCTMETLDEAENYFYNDLEWDPEQPCVKDFMSIVERYFKKSVF